MTRLLTALGAALAIVLGLVGSAAADQVYHSEHVALSPVGGAPLRSGFVENIHPNGPNVYAHEIYVLNGAQKTTTYDVYLIVYPGGPDADCENHTGGAVFGDAPTASLTTNKSGNGKAEVFIAPLLPSPAGLTFGVRWEIKDGNTVMYNTGCRSVALD